MPILQNLLLNSSKYTIKIISIECFYTNLNHRITAKLTEFIANAYDLYSTDTSYQRHLFVLNTDTSDYIQLCHFLKLLHMSTCHCHYHVQCPCHYRVWSLCQRFTVYDAWHQHMWLYLITSFPQITPSVNVSVSPWCLCQCIGHLWLKACSMFVSSWIMYFLKLLLLATCQRRVQCMCRCFIACDALKNGNERL